MARSIRSSVMPLAKAATQKAMSAAAGRSWYLVELRNRSRDRFDTTRVVLRVTDEFGNIRPYANDPIVFKLDGPAELIGDNPFALIGGTGAVWVRAKEQAGTGSLTAPNPR